MDTKQKDRMLALGAVCAIILIGYLMLNIDKLFPTPDVDLSVPQVSMAQFTSDHGTNPNASVTAIEFGDFGCPVCKDNEPDVKQFMATYGKNINFVYKHFPIIQLHPQAEKAAEAAECARDQGKFWEYHDKLFNNQEAQDGTHLLKYAQDIGLDGQQFMRCLDSGDKKDIVQRDFTEGIKARVQGTPTFFINGKKLEGLQTFAQLQVFTDAELGR